MMELGIQSTAVCDIQIGRRCKICAGALRRLLLFIAQASKKCHRVLGDELIEPPYDQCGRRLAVAYWLLEILLSARADSGEQHR